MFATFTTLAPPVLYCEPVLSATNRFWQYLRYTSPCCAHARTRKLQNYRNLQYTHSGDAQVSTIFLRKQRWLHRYILCDVMSTTQILPTQIIKELEYKYYKPFKWFTCQQIHTYIHLMEQSISKIQNLTFYQLKVPACSRTILFDFAKSAAVTRHTG